jgi:Tfp pilus assembly protein PilF
MINFGQLRYDGALGEAQKAVSLDAKYSRAWRELGRVHAALGRRDEAEKEFLKAVSLDPNDWTAHNNLGALYLNLNRLDEAVAEFDRIQALTPDNIRAYNNLGSAYLLQERFDKATEMYERSLSLDRTQTAYSNLGTVLYQQGRYAEAAVSFEAAVALPGATLVHWFNLGAACYWAPDRRGRAKVAYEMAVKLGEETRVKSGRVEPSLLAELASAMRCSRSWPRALKRAPTGRGAGISFLSSNNRSSAPTFSRRSARRTKSWAIGRRRSTGLNRRSRPAIHPGGSNAPRG